MKVCNIGSKTARSVSARLCAIGSALLLCTPMVRAAQAPARAIYRCVEGTVIVYSDSLCAGAPGAEKVDLHAANIYSPVATPAAMPTKRASGSSNSAATKKRAAATAQISQRALPDNSTRCRSISNSIEQIHAKMRAGYRVKEGERLRERESRLNDKLHLERCR